RLHWFFRILVASAPPPGSRAGILQWRNTSRRGRDWHPEEEDGTDVGRPAPAGSSRVKMGIGIPHRGRQGLGERNMKGTNTSWVWGLMASAGLAGTAALGLAAAAPA